MSASELEVHERWMRCAIAKAEAARGSTGDNPWVGCVIVSAQGALLAEGHTQGPGEDHAEIVAMASARRDGADLSSATLYSTLEPCSFHGRTRACAHAILESGLRKVVVGALDPNPRVDGLGLRILREGGAEVLDAVCEEEVTAQLAAWLLRYHPHEPARRAAALAASLPRRDAIARVAALYALDLEAAAKLTP